MLIRVIRGYIIQLQRRFHLNSLEGLDDVALLDVVAGYERDTALEVGTNLLHIVLEALEGVDVASEDDDTVADEACAVVARYLTLTYHSSGNIAHLADVEYLAHLDG